MASGNSGRLFIRRLLLIQITNPIKFAAAQFIRMMTFPRTFYSKDYDVPQREDAGCSIPERSGAR